MSTKKKPVSVPQEIVNHRKGRLVLPDGTVLLPGANEVSAQTVKLVRACDITSIWLKRGFIAIRDQVQPGSVEYDLQYGLPTSIVGLDREVINTAVEQCRSKDQLFKWLEGAADPEVRQLITDRAYQLTAEDAANAAVDAN